MLETQSKVIESHGHTHKANRERERERERARGGLTTPDYIFMLSS